MPPSLASLVVIATESGLPPSDLRTKLAVPLAVLVFIGSIYVLLRANLGTRRGYLVLGCSLFGFLSILALFWTFGAPGTPPATGPQALPGQELNAYEPTWVAFAGDSLIAEQPEYAIVRQYPEGFGPVPPGFAGTAGAGAEDIKSFFSSAERQTKIVQADWVPVPGPEGLRYAEAANGRPIIAVTYASPEGAEDADATPVTVFGYYDAGNPIFPGLLVLGIVFALFVVHVLLLNRDEARERRERAEEAAEEAETVAAGT